VRVGIEVGSRLGPGRQGLQHLGGEKPVIVPVDPEPRQGNQRDPPLGALSGKPGIPNINRNRFPGWSVASCFQESARSFSVKGVASCTLMGGGLAEADSRRPSRSVVEVELSCESFMQGVRVGASLVGAGQRGFTLSPALRQVRRPFAGKNDGIGRRFGPEAR